MQRIKKIILQLKPRNNALSFLLLTGKISQGKTTLMRQSQLQHYPVESERGADIYFNQHGIIVDLGESWLNQNKSLLQHTLKQLNRCHQALKISGILICIDINELFNSEPTQFIEQNQAHADLLKRFGLSLGYKVDVAILFTKLDALAGFCEFFHYEHESNLKKPLGFSLYHTTQQDKMIAAYRKQFDQLIEMLGQQVISKMHPARSSLKRTLIREFPLQLASLGVAIQSLLQHLPLNFFHLQALYFTSAKQGGISQDRLNKKIQHEYALTVQDKFHQSINYRPYFIEGAIQTFQEQTKRHLPYVTISQKWVVGLLSGTAGLSLLWLGHHHIKSSHLLDAASKELLMYETISTQGNNTAPALFHLTQASTALDGITGDSLSLPTIQHLKTQLRLNTQKYLQGNFLPTLLAEIEQTMMDAGQTHEARYQALKIYLMLGDPQKYSQAEVMTWFQHHWQADSPEHRQKKLALMETILRQPLQPIAINQQMVSDVRNYLNALPAGYLYYSLAKKTFPQEKQTITIEGFQLANQEVPAYFTKTGFSLVIQQLATTSQQLQNENWVLARQDLNNLPSILQQAYCYEYVAWWQNFIRRSGPLHFQDYQQARQLAQQLHQSNAINNLVHFIQQQTSPEFGDNSTLFNQEVASQFTQLNLLSQSTTQDLTINFQELEKFMATLSVINDQGKTAFTLTKARFLGDTLTNPLSTLYTRAQQLPEPVSSWVNQVADDAWFILIKDSKAHINQQWRESVLQIYQTQIAQHYPFDATQSQEVTITDFDHFFATHGILNGFLEFYLKPFLDTSHPQWQPKELNHYVLPIAAETINELIRANIITNMFFPEQGEKSNIEFSLQKVSLDPVVSSFQLMLGHTRLYDDQNSESFVRFSWPQSDVKLKLNSIEGKQYELEETGPWAFFKILQKVNVLVDEQDSSSLQILFEVNGNSGRYVLKTQNQINPFTPGVLNGFTLPEVIV
ncbi:Dot/Icm secretion system protein ImcF [Legionella oakridgensis ATCC 33761 = DSM 21215]|uniref:Dot/Icm secretion system protein ImcF n=1 Tax=Legionella oakridgensis ATCC 33761 = DSM 21215 TaxID=1268635 RepID=W0BBJ3_9GAMM|nr:type IVB secretion system protein IcmF [Legionella oakridgensis]AHE67893.1 Dot/Icm secretion system protein ImcF [Legionella oakridgensis ATCC 33761 = DSM 21215]